MIVCLLVTKLRRCISQENTNEFHSTVRVAAASRWTPASHARVARPAVRRRRRSRGPIRAFFGPMSRESAFVARVLLVGGTIPRNVSRLSAGMTGVRVAVGDGAIRRGNGHFQRHSANVLLVHRFHGAIRIR